MENGTPFDMWNLELSTRPRPLTQLSKHLIFSGGLSYCVLGAAALKDSILICHFCFKKNAEQNRLSSPHFIEL